MRTGSFEASEDIIQEAYLRALKYYNPDRVEKLQEWFSILVTNCIREHMASERGYLQDELDEEDVEGVECVNHNLHLMRDIDKMIKQKSDVAQEILNLHFKHQLSPIEITRITTHSYGNCHKIISAFRKELLKVIKQ